MSIDYKLTVNAESRIKD